MGLTYNTITSGKSFDFNTAGSSIMANVYEKANLRLIRDCRIPFIASAEETLEMIDSLSKLSDDVIAELQENCIKYGFAVPEFDLKEFINEWMEFLKDSGGYTCE